MKRIVCLLLCFSLCLLLTGCDSLQSVNPLTEAAATLVPGTDPELPRAEDSQPLRTSSESVLYFRFLDEPYLAQEIRTVTRTASQTYEMALINQLLLGPGTASAELSGLFPEGTRVISTVRQGRTMFITLSQEIMNAYADEPVDWQESSVWRQEVPLRRQLCMQSLVATVTENCDVDEVQVLVQSDGAAVSSLRLKQNYYMDDSEDAVLAEPLRRDDSLLLTADNALRIVLDSWVHQDWSRLYTLIATHDPQTGESRCSEKEFMEQMTALPAVTAYTAGTLSLSADGICATCPVTFSVLREDGSLRTAEARILRLYSDDGIWKTSVTQLTGWMEGME